MLGDAAGLFLADVGLTDGVEQSGLAVVDVAHDGHHRRTRLEVLLATLVLTVGEVEGLQQLAVLVLGRHDLDDVVHLAAEQLECLVADGLRGGHHLAEVEQRLHQRGRVGVDLLGEIGQRRAAGQPDGFAVAVRQPHATDDRRLHRVVFLALLPLRLAATLGRATGTTEGACGSAALARPSAATAAAAGPAAIAGACRGTATATSTAATTACAAAVVTATAAGTAGATALTCAGTTTTRTGPGAAGPRPSATLTRCAAGRRAAGTRRHVARRHAGPRRTRTRCLRTRNRPVNRLRRGERVVADARGARGGLGCAGRRTWPRARGSAWGWSRAARRGAAAVRPPTAGGAAAGAGSAGTAGLATGRLLWGGLGRGGLGGRAVSVGLDLLGSGLCVRRMIRAAGARRAPPRWRTQI